MPVINDYDYRPRSLGSPPGNDEAADRMVPKQPLHFGPDPRFPGRLNYNLRKLSELPHHLLESRMINELKSSVSSCVEEETHTHTQPFDWIFSICQLSLKWFGVRFLLGVIRDTGTLVPFDSGLTSALRTSRKLLYVKPG